MALLNSAAFIAVTGNAVSVSEDLARRFILVRLDAKCEDAENRPFAPGFLAGIAQRRLELLGACLVIWRYGRQNASALKRGRQLGSFETWCEWVRDPLLTLGCADPVARIQSIKANDPKRQHVLELFETWWKYHRSKPVKASELADPLLAMINPQGRTRQYVNSELQRFTGTRVGGFVLTRQAAHSKWGVKTYALALTDPEGGRAHGHGRVDAEPMTPVVPHGVV